MHHVTSPPSASSHLVGASRSFGETLAALGLLLLAASLAGAAEIDPPPQRASLDEHHRALLSAPGTAPPSGGGADDDGGAAPHPGGVICRGTRQELYSAAWLASADMLRALPVDRERLSRPGIGMESASLVLMEARRVPPPSSGVVAGEYSMQQTGAGAPRVPCAPPSSALRLPSSSPRSRARAIGVIHRLVPRVSCHVVCWGWGGLAPAASVVAVRASRRPQASQRRIIKSLDMFDFFIEVTSDVA